MQNTIDHYQFRQLLESLENSDTSIRLRISGKSWSEFASVVLVSEHAMICDENGQRKMITNLRSIVEFEIDKPVLDFRSDCSYSVSY